MTADQDNSLLKGLSIGAGSMAGLGGLLLANKKLGLLGKLVNKFKKPELKGIQLVGKPFVKSDFKPGYLSGKTLNSSIKTGVKIYSYMGILEMTLTQAVYTRHQSQEVKAI